MNWYKDLLDDVSDTQIANGGHLAMYCGRLWQVVAGCGRLWQVVAGCGR